MSELIGTVPSHKFDLNWAACSGPVKADWVVHAQGSTRRYRMLAIAEYDDGAYSAWSPSLPGGAGAGATPSEAICDLSDSLCELVRSYAEAGEQLPVDPDPELPDRQVASLVRWIEFDA